MEKMISASVLRKQRMSVAQGLVSFHRRGSAHPHMSTVRDADGYGIA